MCFYILCCKITNFRRKDKGFYTGANVFLYENLIFLLSYHYNRGLKTKNRKEINLFGFVVAGPRIELGTS